MTMYVENYIYIMVLYGINNIHRRGSHGKS